MPADGRVLLAAPLSLTGRYDIAGRLAAAGIQQAVDDVRLAGGVRLGEVTFIPDVVLLDDGSGPAGVARALETLVGADLLLGPYGSDLVAEAARWAGEHGRVLWNHSGAADDVQQMPGVISVPTPSSRYLAVVLEAVAGRFPAARVLVAAGPGPFARRAAEGAAEAAVRLGMTLVGTVPHAEVPDPPDADVLLAAGSFDDDVTLVARLRSRPPVVAAVAAGVTGFAGEIGRRADGVLGPSQWEEGARFQVDVGPRAGDVLRSLRSRAVPVLRAGVGAAHVDYPAAQAYAAVLVMLHAAQRVGRFDEGGMAEVARGLRCTTFFGPFGLGPDGRQVGHDALVVQWKQGVKRVVWPGSHAEAPVEV